jgi:hypothetical protein
VRRWGGTNGDNLGHLQQRPMNDPIQKVKKEKNDNTNEGVKRAKRRPKNDLGSLTKEKNDC